MSNVPPGIELTETQYGVLRKVFARHVEKVERVSVYGSRVNGRARPGSDVDLVVYGALTFTDMARIQSDLEESDLSILFDVMAYDDISHPPLKDEIDRWGKALFDRAELLTASAA